jgi:hypothetical protein
MWIKAPCRQCDTFAVIGWAQKGSKFDGFYLGELRDGELPYAGKIEVTCTRIFGPPIS